MELASTSIRELHLAHNSLEVYSLTCWLVGRCRFRSLAILDLSYQDGSTCLDNIGTDLAFRHLPQKATFRIQDWRMLKKLKFRNNHHFFESLIDQVGSEVFKMLAFSIFRSERVDFSENTAQNLLEFFRRLSDVILELEKSDEGFRSSIFLKSVKIMRIEYGFDAKRKKELSTKMTESLRKMNIPNLLIQEDTD